MPYIEGKSQKTTLVFDTWANVGDGKLLIHWPCELDHDESKLLGELASSLGYLGRSESWVEAELTADAHDCEWNAAPCFENEHRGPGWEQISLMAAISPGDYEKWRLAQVQKATQLFHGQRQTAAIKKKLAQAIEPFPPELVSCLSKDTAWWKGHGWSQPPGSQRVLYWRRSDSVMVGVPTAAKRIEPPGIECMLLAISTPSGSKSALPSVTRTLPQAEHVRRALICLAADGKRIDCPSLLGKIDGERIRGSHDHAHFIPLDLDGDQHLDHILIYAPGKLCSTAQRAVRSLKRTWTKGGVGELQLALAGSGKLEALRNLPRLGFSIDAILGFREGSRVWESITPFVPPRFLKAKGKDTLDGQVQAELTARGFPTAESIDADPDLTKRFRHFVRRRAHGGVPPKMDAGFGFRLTFAKPVRGPLVLGYASHYGLGLFRAVLE